KPTNTIAIQMLSDVDRRENEYLREHREKEEHYKAALDAWHHGEVSAALSKLERVLELDRRAPVGTRFRRNGVAHSPRSVSQPSPEGLDRSAGAATELSDGCDPPPRAHQGCPPQNHIAKLPVPSRPERCVVRYDWDRTGQSAGHAKPSEVPQQIDGPSKSDSRAVSP